MKTISQDQANSLAATTAVITHNMFDEVLKFVRQGVMNTYDQIIQIATAFEEKHQEIKWGEQEGYEVWDECVIAFTQDYIKERKI